MWTNAKVSACYDALSRPAMLSSSAERESRALELSEQKTRVEVATKRVEEAVEALREAEVDRDSKVRHAWPPTPCRAQLGYCGVHPNFLVCCINNARVCMSTYSAWANARCSQNKEFEFIFSRCGGRHWVSLSRKC